MIASEKMVWALVVFALATGPGPVAEESGLAAFGELVVGEWQAEDSRHTFEWGVGRRVVRTKSYFKTEGTWELVSEGMWFWDDAEKTIRGVAVATGMPIELFEYHSRVQGDQVVHDLVAHGTMGGIYEERWRFADGEYRWALKDPTEGKEIMNGSYRRVDRGTPDGGP